MRIEQQAETEFSAQILGKYSIIAFAFLLKGGSSGDEVAMRREDDPAKVAPPDPEDLVAKGMALDELVEAIKRAEAKSDKAQGDADLDDATKKLLKKLYKKAVAKLQKATKDLIDDYAAEVEALPEGTDKEKKGKEAFKKSAKAIKEKFEKDSGIKWF